MRKHYTFLETKKYGENTKNEKRRKKDSEVKSIVYKEKICSTLSQWEKVYEVLFMNTLFVKRMTKLKMVR